jgi:outer membrane lipase/esterase
MRVMKKLAVLGAALLLASCGGGGKPGFSSLVSFGDSLSDVGTYQVGTIAALGGGKFTVNGPGARIWTEMLAMDIGAAAPCPAQKGLLPNIPGVTGAAVTNQAACTNYAQGSARVTHPLGPNAAGLQAAPFNQVTLGLMAMPVTNQISNHLAKIGGTFSGTELVTVLAGGNDIFMNLNGVSVAAGGGAAAVGGALAAGWSTSVQNAVAAGGAAAAGAAAQAAVAAMGQAGAELATLVKSQLVAKGARYVVVVNLPDVSLTPFGLRLDAQTRGLVTSMTNAFNTQLQSGLGTTPNILYVDFFAQQKVVVASPASFGLQNITTEACDPASPLNPFQGSSIACTEQTLRANTAGYQYADGVHPSPLGHTLIADFVAAQMSSFGWL